MDRQYKAFISYRHLPLDKEAAKKVHRAIEHFVIPRALRRDGKRKLGYVFRDEDELPLSGELTDNIRHALENSEYLIVVCTPETAKSVWVMKEIEIFLQLRDRAHVLLVLADGKPEESFPRVITEVRDANGQIIGEYEPMAANLNAPTAAGRRRKFKVEILRILAGLLGCAYDELYQRERRWKRRRAAILMGLAGLVAAVFIGMLLNRNAEIRRQLEESRRNESLALAALSENAYQDGKYNTALRYAIDALPSQGNDRPYVPEAEAALRKELGLHDSAFLRYSRSFEQDVKIRDLIVSQDGKRLFTADPFGCIRAYDLDTGACLWTWSDDREERFNRMELACDSSRLLLDCWGRGMYVLSAEDGAVIWQDENMSGYFSREERSVFIAMDASDDSVVSVRRAEDGSEIASFSIDEIAMSTVFEIAISPDERYLAVLTFSYDEDDEILMALLDLETQGYRMLSGDLKMDWSMDYVLSFSQENSLAVAGAIVGEPITLQIVSPENDWEEPLKIHTGMEYRDHASLAGARLNLLAWDGSSVLLGSQVCLRSFNAGNGKENWAIELEGNLCGWALYDNGSLGLVLDSGLICFASKGMMLTKDAGYSFSCRYSVSKAVVRGQRYASSRFLVVPEGEAYRVALIQVPEHPDWISLAAAEEEIPKSAAVTVSPSGEKLAAFSHNEESLDGCVLNLRDGNKHIFSIPLPERFYENSNEYYLTEDCVLLCGGVRFLLEEGRMERLTGDPGTMTLSDYGFLSAVVADGRVLTAQCSKDQCCFWYDGRYQRAVDLPESMEWAKCIGVGANGWVLLQSKENDVERYHFLLLHPESGSMLPLEDGSQEKPICGFPVDKAWMAWLEKEQVEILDLYSGETLWSFPIPIPVSSVIHMEFCRNDSILILFTQYGEILLFDVESGELLARTDFGDSTLGLDRDAAFSVKELPERKQMLIFIDYWLYQESICMLLETESWKTLEVDSSPICYDAVDDRMILYVYRSGLFAAPFYSREELIAQARTILEPEKGSD